MRLRMGVYLPGETIFRVGDVGHEMWVAHCTRMGRHGAIFGLGYGQQNVGGAWGAWGTWKMQGLVGNLCVAAPEA